MKPMKQRDIDRWANRQARMNRQAHMPVVNWAAVAVVVTIVLAVLFILLESANLL